MHPRGNRFCRERRFSPQPRRNLQLEGVTLSPGQQICFLQTLPLQFLGNDPLRLGLGTGPVQLTGVMVPKLAP